MKKCLQQISGVIVIGLCILSVFIFNKPVYADSDFLIAVDANKTVKLPFLVTCTDNKQESTYQGQDVGLFREEGFRPLPFNDDFKIFTEMVLIGGYSQQSNGDGKGELSVVIKNDNESLPKGEYFIGIKNVNYKEYQPVMKLNNPGSSSRGYLSADYNKEHKFNTGNCSTFNKPEKKPFSNVTSDKQPSANTSIDKVVKELKNGECGGLIGSYKGTCISEFDSCIKGYKDNYSESEFGNQIASILSSCIKITGKAVIKAIESDLKLQVEQERQERVENKVTGQSGDNKTLLPVVPVVNSNYQCTHKPNWDDEVKITWDKANYKGNISFLDISTDKGFNSSWYNKGVANQDSAVAPKDFKGWDKQKGPVDVQPLQFLPGQTYYARLAGDSSKYSNSSASFTAPAACTAAQPAGAPAEQAETGQKTAQKTDLKTDITAHIHGQSGGTIAGIDTDNGRIAVGIRVTSEDKEDCVIDDVDLKWEKVGSNEDLAVSYDLVAGEQDSLVYQNCQSYWAPLKGDGTYRLTASYPGYPEGEYNEDNIHYEASGPVAVEVVIAGSQAQISTSSLTEVETQGEGKWILTPKTTIGGRLDTDKIPTVHFTVTKVLNDSSVQVLIDDANYPNGEAKVISKEDLGDLSQVNRLEAVTSYADPGSEYASSQGVPAVIRIAASQVEEEPWVKLSSDPSLDMIIAGDSQVAITATSNRAVENPVFEVIHNGQAENPPVVSSFNGCANGNGICEYTTVLYMPDGDYTINFRSNDVAAEPLAFSIGSTDSEEQEKEEEAVIEKREIRYNGNVYDVPGDIYLGPGENILQLVTYFNKGEPNYADFTVIVELEQPEGEQFGPTPTPFESTEGSSRLKWYCGDGEVIMQVENGNTTSYRDCAAEGKRCVPITTEGYESDADCIPVSPEQASEPAPEQAPAPQLRWYCQDDTVIMQVEGEYTSVYHDCNDEGESCRLINTPGYESDAECYLPE